MSTEYLHACTARLFLALVSGRHHYTLFFNTTGNLYRLLANTRATPPYICADVLRKYREPFRPSTPRTAPTRPSTSTFTTPVILTTPTSSGGRLHGQATSSYCFRLNTDGPWNGLKPRRGSGNIKRGAKASPTKSPLKPPVKNGDPGPEDKTSAADRQRAARNKNRAEVSYYFKTILQKHNTQRRIPFRAGP